MHPDCETSLSCTHMTCCCCCSATKPCLILCDRMHCSKPGFLSFPISWSLLRFRSIELVTPSNHLILCCPLLLLPSVLNSIRVFFFFSPMSQLFASGGKVLCDLYLVLHAGPKSKVKQQSAAHLEWDAAGWTGPTGTPSGCEGCPSLRG